MIRGVLVRFRSRELVRGDRRLRLGPVGFRLVTALLAAGDLDRRTLVDHLWGDERDGGPDDAGQCLRLAAYRCRRPLEHLGLVLVPGRRLWTLADGWTPAEAVAHLEAAARQAEAVAARAMAQRAVFANLVAAELRRIAA